MRLNQTVKLPAVKPTNELKDAKTLTEGTVSKVLILCGSEKIGAKIIPLSLRAVCLLFVILFELMNSLINSKSSQFVNVITDYQY